MKAFASEQKPQILGSCTLFIMYPHTTFLYQSGPLPQYGTCGGAMCCTRKFAETHHFVKSSTKTEELAFINGATVGQVDNFYNINMVFVHDKNTVRKDNVTRFRTKMRWLDVIQDVDILQFYLSKNAPQIDLKAEYRMISLHKPREVYGSLFMSLSIIQTLQKLQILLLVHLQQLLLKAP